LFGSSRLGRKITPTGRRYAVRQLAPPAQRIRAHQILAAAIDHHDVVGGSGR
jgi:hypothetical protein